MDIWHRNPGRFDEKIFVYVKLNAEIGAVVNSARGEVGVAGVLCGRIWVIEFQIERWREISLLPENLVTAMAIRFLFVTETAANSIYVSIDCSIQRCKGLLNYFTID